MCSAGTSTLQAAYNGGNTIATTDNRDIAFTLANTTTDSNFTIAVADGSTSTSSFTRVDGAGTSDPSQLILIDNLDTDRAVAAGNFVSPTTENESESICLFAPKMRLFATINPPLKFS